jgi:hypothetical protein
MFPVALRDADKPKLVLKQQGSNSRVRLNLEIRACDACFRASVGECSSDGCEAETGHPHVRVKCLQASKRIEPRS